jgi:pimeloyl-ACP methyl ester carboxylesterase
MSRAIIYNVLGALVVITIIVLKIPVVWVIVGGLAILVLVILDPFSPPVESVPKGFTEKKFNTGKVILNYVEGPKNGPPLLFIPGQMEFWQGYKLVIPHFSKTYHVFVVDVRGHGKSTRTPGEYSYNIIGQDLGVFLEQVIQQPAIVSGLSSGAVLAIWLAANAPEFVYAAISEDPPLFSAMYPRIEHEAYMYRIFQVAIDTLGKPKRDILDYFMKQGIPKEGQKELLLIPAWIAKFIVGDFEFNKKLRPNKKYDVPMAPYSGKLGFKFISEYDVDFSKATIDGRLTEGFDPDQTLGRIRCPMLLIHAKWSRDKNWGLIGAMDDGDAEKIRSSVKDLTYVKVDSFHDVHLSKPKIFIKVVDSYLESLRKERVLQGRGNTIRTATN